MKKRLVASNVAGIDNGPGSARKRIAILEELLQTEVPSPTEGMAAIDRRRLARLQDTREALQDQLATLRRLYPEASGVDGPKDRNDRRTGLWVPATCLEVEPYHPAPVGAQPNDGFTFLPLASLARTQPNDNFTSLLAQFFRSHVVEFLPSVVIDDEHTLIQNAMQRVRRKLRDLAGLIRLIIRSLAEPDHPHSFVSKECPWYLLHGAHPPHLLALTARPVPFRAVDRQNTLGALAA